MTDTFAHPRRPREQISAPPGRFQEGVGRSAHSLCSEGPAGCPHRSRWAVSFVLPAVPPPLPADLGSQRSIRETEGFPCSQEKGSQHIQWASWRRRPTARALVPGRHPGLDHFSIFRLDSVTAQDKQQVLWVQV